MSPRSTRLVRAASLILFLTGLLAALRALPLDVAMAGLQSRVASSGALGVVLFGATYVLAALLFVPGAALTAASGALFGPVRGTMIVSVASTVSAALAFLVARHLARSRVDALASRYRVFRAVDRAITDGGWKVVGLLRLSPAVPFSAGNYLFGLTSVRFWPYVLASWAFMLPGTLLYVWLGHAGRLAAGGSRSAAEWAFLGVGLTATAGVTWYLTRLARRRLESKEVSTQPAPVERDERARGPRAALLPISALLVFALGAYAQLRKDTLAYLFGPPAVAASEAYGAGFEAATFGHASFDALLKRHVTEGGEVDYEGLRGEASALDGYITALGTAHFSALGRDEKLALLVNAYNAFTLRLILDHWPVASIRDIPAGKRWKDRRWNLGGRTLSLDQIEHEEVRPKFREPRVHFALVCAARGCPPLRREAYVGARIDSQLDDQARYVHTQPRWFRWDGAANTVHLTALYRWYDGDFEQEAGSVLRFVGRYAPPVHDAVAADRPPRIRWIEYDWSLNRKAKTP
jgi:uncharacterized membrane protein YdjX (TVP38/TMEM64 family)